MTISSDDLKQLCLIEIDKLLRGNGKSLEDFECMPKLDSYVDEPFNNILLANELSYDSAKMFSKHGDLFVNLNEEQLFAYHQILEVVYGNLGRMFFVDGYGGTGKTYLWNALSFKLCSEGKILLNVSSSGIASLLLPGEKIAHSQFAIPLVLVEDSFCKIDKDSKKAELLAMASLIIWDEAPMINRLAFQAFDRTLRDIMNKNGGDALSSPFGGKTIVFGGDFRQILLVLPKGGHADVVHATINSSQLWRWCKALKLTKNMRLEGSSNSGETESLRDFAQWILNIGDGRIREQIDGEASVEIAVDLLVKTSSDYLADIVEATYPDLLQNMQEFSFFQDRAILAPTLVLVERVNDFVMTLIPGEEKEYLSCDTICKCDEDVGIDQRWITTEFLNDIKCSGMPNHKLHLKVGVPVMLLKNIDVSSGLCNDTRLTIASMGKNIISATIVNVPHSGEIVYIT